jgi:hypothetical protein
MDYTFEELLQPESLHLVKAPFPLGLGGSVSPH